MIARTAIATAMTLAVAACGGGGGSMSIAPEGPHAYTPTAGTHHSYTPYVTPSHIFSFGIDAGTTFGYIGGDLEPRENLRRVGTKNGIHYYLGVVRDGSGVSRLERYETDLKAGGGKFAPFTIQPTIHFDIALQSTTNQGLLLAVWDSIYILNDVLPPEFQIKLGTWRNDDGDPDHGEIVVRLDTAAGIRSTCGNSNAVACAQRWVLSSNHNAAHSAVIHIPNDFDTTEYTYPRSTIVHELLHALGIAGHVDSIEFPDSIMGTSGEYIPNLGHIISRIDREALQIIYMSQRTDLYNDWNEWSDTSFHLVGRTRNEALNFGVALFNGLPQPWARGVVPRIDLADNLSLAGTATWNGALLGFSGPSPVAGDASLQVNMGRLSIPNSEHDLRFRDIYFLNRFESRDADRWFHTRNIDYKVNITGNTFENVDRAGAEQGLVTGAFMGARHEHMSGTVKRTDMVGAFGGSR